MSNAAKLDPAYLARIGFAVVMEGVYVKKIGTVTVCVDYRTGDGTLDVQSESGVSAETSVRFQTVTQLKWFVACFQ